MLRSYLSSFILIVSCANSIMSQQVRPLPNPLINIQCGQLGVWRTTGLVSPALNQQVPMTCTYRINAISFQICQMRLDFNQFSMAGPTVNANGAGAAFPQCNDDYLEVNGMRICGENSGQHIYIPVNPRLVTERTLTITITTRNGMGTRPVWSIAVNQLECPLGQVRSLNPLLPASNLAANEIPRSPRALVSEWLAPPGCLQYFIQPTGQIESFNFNNGAGPYIGNMNYAICFRRTRANTALKIIPTIFRLNNGNPNSNGFDDDCFGQVSTIGRSEDYLFIPNAELTSSLGNPNGVIPPTRARLFCGQSLTSLIATSTPPGPFSMLFNSDQVYAPAEEIGFRLQYEIV